MSFEDEQRARRRLQQMRQDRELRERKAIAATPQRVTGLAEQIHDLSLKNAELEERLAQVESKLDWLLRYSSGNLDG